MGLEMFLFKREFYFPKNYSSMKITLDDNSVEISSDEYLIKNNTIGNWRKANAIHRWFVENVQGGIDNQAYYPVQIYQLEELLNLCKLVKDNPILASEMLPTYMGYFFGSLEYDEDYFSDIDDTIEILELALSDKDKGYYYSSSW